MTESASGKKSVSMTLLALGVVMLIAALYFDITKNYSGLGSMRGAFLVCGALLILAGVYYIPTVLHHRAIINFIFLFPLLFTFAVTVIIPISAG